MKNLSQIPLPGDDDDGNDDEQFFPPTKLENISWLRIEVPSRLNEKRARDK